MGNDAHPGRYHCGIGAIDAGIGPPDSRGVGIAVLGPVAVDGSTDRLGRRDRVVLTALAVRAGDPVSADELADAIWNDGPPSSAAKVVQGCVVRLRKLLGRDAIETVPGGYRLALPATRSTHTASSRVWPGPASCLPWGTRSGRRTCSPRCGPLARPSAP